MLQARDYDLFDLARALKVYRNVHGPRSFPLRRVLVAWCRLLPVPESRHGHTLKTFVAMYYPKQAVS